MDWSLCAMGLLKALEAPEAHPGEAVTREQGHPFIPTDYLSCRYIPTRACLPQDTAFIWAGSLALRALISYCHLPPHSGV